jgi:prepilin-type N-terminal cleavage/methylation domain-containing protein
MKRYSTTRLAHHHALRRREHESSRGFTLIELLTVVVVVGVVSTVAAVALGQLHDKSVSAQCQADATKISTAISLVKAQYPGTVVNQSILLTSGGVYEGPYLPSWPDNRPHYDFYLVEGVLNIQSPAGSATTSGATLAAGEPFAGVNSCTGVSS